MLALGMAGLLVLAWLVQPDRLARFALDRVGGELGLEIRATGPASYHLRPTPVLHLGGIEARRPGADQALFSSGRVLLALPWSSLRGETADIARVEIDAPMVDLDALDAWLATRPPAAPQPLPVLRGGLGIRDGRVLGAGWRLSIDMLSLDRIDPARPSSLTLAGGLAIGTDADAIPTPLLLRLDGQPSGRLDALHVELASASLHIGAQSAPDAIRISLDGGQLRIGDGVHLAGPTLRVDGPPPLPPLLGEARLGWAERRLSVDYRGTLAAWPQDWPPLPSPLQESPAPWDWALRYDGPQDLDAPLALVASRPGLAFDGRSRVFELLAWVEATDRSPLPPLEGTLQAEALVVEGTRLEGVRMQLRPTRDASDDAAEPRR